MTQTSTLPVFGRVLARASPLLVAVIACTGQVEFTAPREVPPVPSRLTTGSGEKNNPRFTPDGRAVLFHSDRDGDFDIYRLSLDDGTVEPLTSTSSHERRPAPSPDGRRFVFDSDRSGETSLWIQSMAGGEARRLVERTDLTLLSGDWSPDGRWIAATGLGPEGAHIWLVESDGSGLQRLTQGGDEYLPRWTADGRSLVYFLGDTDDVLSVDLATGRSHPVSRGEWVGWHPVLHPDGRRLVFVGQPDRWSLHAFDLESRTLTRLTRAGDDAFPDVSPDGRRLVFSSRRNRAQLLSVTLDGGVTLDAATQAVAVQFAPDGSRLLLIDGERSMELHRSTSGGETTIARGLPILVTSPQTSSFERSPDGKWILFASSGGELLGHSDLYRLPTVGGVPERLTAIGDTESGVWCDDDTVLFSSSGGDPHAARQVWRLDLGREPLAITDSPEGKWPTDCRDNGALLVYTRIRTREVVVARHEGGGWSERLVGSGVAGRFSPDGSGLAFIARSAEGRDRLAIWKADGSVTTLTDGTRALASPAWAPDGSKLVILGRETDRDLWLLELGS